MAEVEVGEEEEEVGEAEAEAEVGEAGEEGAEAEAAEAAKADQEAGARVTTGGQPAGARVAKRELRNLLTSDGPHIRFSVGDKVMGKWGGVRGGMRGGVHQWLPAEVVYVGSQHFGLKYDDDDEIEYNVRNPSQTLDLILADH